MLDRQPLEQGEQDDACGISQPDRVPSPPSRSARRDKETNELAASQRSACGDRSLVCQARPSSRWPEHETHLSPVPTAPIGDRSQVGTEAFEKLAGLDEFGAQRVQRVAVDGLALARCEHCR